MIFVDLKILVLGLEDRFEPVRYSCLAEKEGRAFGKWRNLIFESWQMGIVSEGLQLAFTRPEYSPAWNSMKHGVLDRVLFLSVGE